MKNGKAIGLMFMVLGGVFVFFFLKNTSDIPVPDRPEGWWLPLVLFGGLALCSLLFIFSKKKVQ